MKQVFELLAAYNEQTNREMLQILGELPAGEVAKERGSYFGSILGIINHILVSDVIWLERFSDSIPMLAEVRRELPRFELKKWTDIIWKELMSFTPVRERVDKQIHRVVALLPDTGNESVLRYSNSRGQSLEKTAWKAFLHFFNHQTHHRGQVAILLDQLSVKNDYSNLIWKF